MTVTAGLQHPPVEAQEAVSFGDVGGGLKVSALIERLRQLKTTPIITN